MTENTAEPAISPITLHDDSHESQPLHQQICIDQTLLDAFPCIALLLRPRTREIVASNRLAHQVGAVPGTKCFSSWAQRDSPCPWCLAPTMWATGKPQHLEVEALGIVWDAHWIPVSEDLYMHYAFDITERKKTEQALKESEEKYRQLFVNMLNGFEYCKVVFDDKGTPVDAIVLEVNSAFEKLVRIKKTDILGKKVSERLGDRETYSDFFNVFRRVVLTGKTELFELYVKPAELWLSISAYRPKEGYFAALFEDVTEQKKAQMKLEAYSKGLESTVAKRTEELILTNDRLVKAERFAAIGELAGMVGHDLRNPLTAIKNAVYYLERKQSPQAEEKTKEIFKVINKSIEHSNKIIGNLLEYSKEIHLEIEECTPKSLIDYILLLVQIPHNIKITERTQDQPILWVDTNKMERVFINIIQNAIDAMPKGGTLEIRSEQIGEMVQFTFVDSGEGMTENIKARIFTPLFTTKAQGMGFGLAICKRILEAHNGTIAVESGLGKGTKFIINLPTEHKMKFESESPAVAPEDFLSRIQDIA